MMSFSDAVRTVVLKKYATFSGRAARPEFWWFMLFTIGLSILFGLLGWATGAIAIFDGIDTLVSLALLIPTFAVSWRRLHDIDRDGWWCLIPLAPALVAGGAAAMGSLTLVYVAVAVAVAAVILTIVWYAKMGQQGANRFGEDPYGEVDAAIFS